jgi:PUA domain protein
MKIRTRYHLRKGVVESIIRELRNKNLEYAALLQRGDRVEALETDRGRLIMVNGKIVIFEIGGSYFPTIKGALLLENKHRYVTVDRGAVGFISRGAHVMRPGVVDHDPEIKKGDLVVIKEETHGKPLAIGRSLWRGEEFITRKRGKCVENIHYVGDEIWETG